MRIVDFFDANMIVVHVGDKTEKKAKKISQLVSGLSHEDDKVRIIWKQGDPVTTILETAATNNVDLIMLGAIPREDLLKFYLGSIARKITRKAQCSVLLIVKPTEDLRPCNHIIVNGLQDQKTEQTILNAFEVAQNIGAQQVTIVEEIAPQEVHVQVEDDKSLRKDLLRKEKIRRKEELRVHDILEHVPIEYKEGISIKTQSIFGKRGYSIGHYAKVVNADLLVMNAPSKNSLWKRIFTRDLEHILSELPTDVLIIR